MNAKAELALLKDTSRDASSEWLAAQSPPHILTADEIAAREAVISGELYRLRLAYPIQARNYSDEEVDMINRLWSEIFIGVEPQLLHEAIKRFMVNDRKSFFPSPGQIVGCVETIIAEKKIERERIATERHWAQFRATQALIDGGENCGTCRHCRIDRVAPNWIDAKYTAWRMAVTDEEKSNLCKEKLSCENPNGSYYEGEHNWGTTREKRCEMYEPPLPAIAATAPPPENKVKRKGTKP